MHKLSTLIALAVLAAGCGSATVKLQMDNQTGAGALVGGLDRTFRMKLIAVYVSEDVDPVTQNNVGMTSMVWLNPECNDDIQRCVPSGVPGDGPRVSQFFDFSLPTDEVNAALNSQGNEIEPGTYRYARIEFCKYGAPGEANLVWSGPGMSAERELIVGDCARTSAAFDPPLELGSGDTFTVTLGYDLAASIVTGAPSPASTMSLAGENRWYRDCADLDAETRVCMDFPDFTPSARKQ